MPSQKKGNKSKHNNNNDNDDDLKQEGNVKLQAVLLADAVFGSKVTAREDYQSFGLRPWSSEASTSSQILCPINNVPLVDYILDFLASNGVEQVIIILGSCATSTVSGSGSSETALEDYLKDHTSNYGSLEILFLKDTSLTNAGDALRELYKRNWIRASKQALPFLLVSGDVVADLDLGEAMKAHKDRNSHDSAAVMTVVLKPVQQHDSYSNMNSNSNNTSDHTSTSTSTNPPPPSIVPRASDLVVGLVGAYSKTVATADAQASEKDPSIDDRNDYRVMYYDNGSAGNSATHRVTLPCVFLTQSQTQSTGPARGGGGLVVRHDLMDTGIAICSPDVLGRLEDEFDYLDLAHDFVTNSVAEEEDGLQTRVYAHILENHTSNSFQGATRSYAARAVDFQTYHAISKDLLQRWAYPTVADHRVNAKGNSNSSCERRYKLVKVADHHRHHRKSTSGSQQQQRQRPLRSIDNTGSGHPQRKSSATTNTKTTTTTTIDPFEAARSSHNNNNQYQYKEVLNPTKVGRTSLVVGPGMMGSHGSVGEDCLVARCVLGDSVTVGDGAQLLDCHVMDGVSIESHATLDSCVVASNAIICEGATLGKGCYVGEGCVIGIGVAVKPFTRVTLAKDDEDDDWGDDDGGYSDSDDNSDSIDDDDSDGNSKKDSDEPPMEAAGTVVGPDGKGTLWKPALDNDDFSDDDDDDDNGNTDPLESLLQLQSIGGDPTAYYRKEARRLAAKDEEDFEDDGFSDHDEDEMMAETQQAFSEFTGGTVTFGDNDDDDDDHINLNYNPNGPSASDTTVIGRQKGVDVVKEMTEICMEFDDDCHPIENLAIELNSFKFSQNATYGDCAQACLFSLLRKMDVSPAMTDGRMVSLLNAKLETFWKGMLQKLCRSLAEEVSIVEALEHAATIDQQQQQQDQNKDPLQGQAEVGVGLDAEATDALQKSTEIARKLRSGMAFRFFLQTLHDQEVLSEEAILQWAGERRKVSVSASGGVGGGDSSSDGDNNNDDTNNNDPKQALFRMQSVQDFLEWLEDDDDDSDSDSDSDGSDEDSD